VGSPRGRNKEEPMNYWKVSTFVLAGVVGLGAVYETAKPAQAEAQPNMEAALGMLKGAKGRLQAATHDKGGHRVKAIAATNTAIQEVEAGIAYDNAHHEKK